jgi:3-hydroxyacyl-[acyl-carrier-protein] dehydratase
VTSTPVKVVDDVDDVDDVVRVSRTVHIDPTDPVFAGHYPGFPILPGLFLVEYVHETVAGGMRAVALDSVRFVRPVFPGDELRIEATLTDRGEQLCCAATISSRSGVVAEVRLRYPPRLVGGASC